MSNSLISNFGGGETEIVDSNFFNRKIPNFILFQAKHIIGFNVVLGYVLH